MMPKPCFQTIQASGIFRIFEQCGISGVRIPHALDSAGTLGPALRGFPSIQWEVGQLLWVREEGGVGKLGPPCDISVGGHSLCPLYLPPKILLPPQCGHR